jgi:hypothetical protein
LLNAHHLNKRLDAGREIGEPPGCLLLLLSCRLDEGLDVGRKIALLVSKIALLVNKGVDNWTTVSPLSEQ